jgi:hypothetical protein
MVSTSVEHSALVHRAIVDSECSLAENVASPVLLAVDRLSQARVPITQDDASTGRGVYCRGVHVFLDGVS